MDEDIFFNILLNSDIQDIELLCSTSKKIKLLCNGYFWEQKTYHDKLPILTNNINKEYYIKILSLYKYSLLLISKYNNIKFVPIKYEDIFKILSVEYTTELLEYDDNTYKYVCIVCNNLHTKNIPINITTELYYSGDWINEHGDEEFIENVNKSELINTIIRLNWYYPKIEYIV